MIIPIVIDRVMTQQSGQRLPAEWQHKIELDALAKRDKAPKPKGWRLSPQAVRTFILGSNGKKIGKNTVSRKIFGNDVVVERAIVTLAGQRGLMLVGEPGTAKSMLSELLAAAICGVSTHTVQGSAGTVEENIRYSWNYALLLRDGPSPQALVPGPLYRAMQHGQIMRFEEITRCPIEIQDSLIPVLSDRILHISELQDEQNLILSQPGFNVIATANLRDRGVNEMSAALKRRFNFETMQPLHDRKAETELVHREVNRLLAEDGVQTEFRNDVAELLVTVFQELRSGKALGTGLEPLSSVLSTAEAINVAYSTAAEHWYLGEGDLQSRQLLRHLRGTVIKDDEDDRKRVKNYLRLVRSKRAQEPVWEELLQGEQWL